MKYEFQWPLYENPYQPTRTAWDGLESPTAQQFSIGTLTSNYSIYFSITKQTHQFHVLQKLTLKQITSLPLQQQLLWLGCYLCPAGAHLLCWSIEACRCTHRRRGHPVQPSTGKPPFFFRRKMWSGKKRKAFFCFVEFFFAARNRISIWVFPKILVPQNGWFIVVPKPYEQMGWFGVMGVFPFLETSIYFYGG